MKKIALTQRLIQNDTYPETRDALDIRWAEFCVALNVLPVILPSSFDFRLYFKAQDISGIVFTGGNDLYSVSKSTMSLQRDTFEKSLLQFAIENNVPVLGVCRGMQLIAEHFGASLQHVEGHAGTTHEITMLEGCTCFTSATLRQSVNSFHSYAVAALPPSIRAIASSADGVVEAMEHVRLPIAALMWHPEREAPFVIEDVELFRQLFKL